MEYRIEYIDGKEFRYPVILYKYRDWDNLKHRNILQDNTIYFASPKSFEDIYDCNVPESFPVGTKLYDMFLQKSKVDYPNKTRQEHREFARHWSKHSPLAKPRLLKEKIEQFNTVFNNRFGVLSLTANPHNEGMWEKYGNSHKGFCVGFDTGKLFEAESIGGGEVQYSDELPTIDFINDDFKTKHIKNIFFKETKWQFEQEYRLHKMWKNDVSNADRNIKLPKGCIVGIILGKRMSNNDKENIKNIARSKYPYIEISEES